ncbi:MAG: isoaspartyl peptidase/L-asparaginase, partial [Gemmatimonadaceae bacterium]
MRRFALLLLIVAACAPVTPSNIPAPLDEEHPRLEWGMVLHGGAGVTRTSYSAAELPLMEATFHAALRAGHAILAGGGSGLDAVEAAVRILEDDSLFNAGKGAVFTNDSINELDAAIMEGHTYRAGAVAGLHRVKNPITLARAVMERSKHVMMIGDGAERFAVEQRIE